MSVDEHLLAAQLPVIETRFVGRRRELALLHRSIGSAARLVTLVGAGGTGKTRLALELAAETLSLEAYSPFRDGVIWVDLAAITDPTRVWQAVSHAVGLGAGAANLDPAEALVRALCDRRLLLVVDNCEELVARCRELAEVLLAGCPDLVILATSRTPLHSSYEQLVSVPPMSAEAAFGERSEAAELFYDRAARVLPAYPSQADDLDSVNALCRLVDGLPLALELAAPWIRTLSARDLLAEIDHSMDLLSSADSTLTGRHRSMGTVLARTWRWLSSEERRALRALGVFVGGISAEAAAAVAGASPALLAALGERSLIHRLPDTERGPRYSMHELVRQHALEMLQAEGPAAVNTVRARHLDFFLQLYERARADIDGPDEVRWTGQVRRELANASAARAWAVTSGRPESALRLTAALAPVWGGLSGTVSYQDEFQEALALPWDAASDVAAAARATVLNAAGFAAMSAGDLPAARRHFEDASSLYQHLGDQVLYARALNNVGWAVSRGPDPESGLGYLRQGLAICQRAADPLGIAWSHYDLGEVLFLVGQDAEAERLVLGGLRQMTELGVPFGIVASQITLGHAYRRQGRWGQAIEAYAGALRAHLGSPGAHGSDVLAGLGVVALALERPDNAAWLFGAGQAWGDAHGTNSLLNPSRDLDEPQAAAARRQSDPEWAWHYEVGRRLMPKQALTEAEDVVAELLTLCRAPARDILTEREQQVLRLVAQGLSDADIADTLVLSPRTVQAHLRSVFHKLEVKSRSAAVHAAVQLDLVPHR